MKTKARVTVIVLIYNDAKYGAGAIQSVLAQSFRDFELLILDNGSTDGTPEMIREFAADPRVRIITNRINQRSEFATKTALKVETEFLSFLFADDRYRQNRLSEMLKALEKAPKAAAVFSNNAFIDENSHAVKNIPFTQFAGDVSAMTSEQHLQQFFLRGNSLHPCAMMIRTAEYQRLGGFQPFLHRLGDMAFFARLLTETEVQFLAQITQDITLWASERNESARSKINWDALAYERIVFLESYRSKNGLARLEKIFPEVAQRLSNEAGLAERLFWLAHRAYVVAAIDYKIFAMSCFYDSYRSASERIDQICEQNYGRSFSQFISWVQDGGLGEPQPKFKRLKASLKRHAPFAWIHGWLAGRES